MRFPRIVGDALADVAIDSTGHVETLEIAYQLTRTDGVTMLISGPKAGYNISLNPEPLHFGRTVMGFQVITESRPHRQIPRYIKLVNAGKLKLKELITDSVSLRRHQCGGRKDAEWGTDGTVYHRARRALRRGT